MLSTNNIKTTTAHYKITGKQIELNQSKMDPSGVPFVVPQTSTISVNDKPVSISNISTTRTTIPISQSQNIYTGSEVTTSIPNTNYKSHSQPSSTPNYTLRNNPPGLCKLYHEDTQVFVLEKYCRPLSDTFSTLELGCKFNKRDCVVSKTKTLGKGRNMEELSDTVYHNPDGSTKKYNYKTVDTRLVNCFNKLCKSTNSKIPKCFHYVCYRHMMESQTDSAMKVLKVESEKDKIVDHLIKGIKIKDIQNRILLHEDNTNLIFPVCGKRCYNTVTFNRYINDTKGVSEYASGQSWDNDGGTKNKSSIDVLIEWLTTEENSSNYFGGLDTDGRTNSNRKETYHLVIRDLIKQENGTDRSPDSIKSKIIRIMGTYKEASERMHRTGNGITDPLKYSSFQEYIVREVCRYYFELEPILKDRPNVTPWATNEDDSDDSTDSDISDEEDDSDIEVLSSEDNAMTNKEVATKEKNKYKTNVEEFDENMSTNSQQTLSHNTFSNISNSSDDNVSLKLPSLRNTRKRESTGSSGNTSSSTSKRSPKVTPLEAKLKHKKLRNKRKKSIVSRKSNNMSTSFATMETEDRDRLLARNNKINFEKERHNDMKRLEEEKLKIERQRLEMEKDIMTLKHEQIKVQSTLERSKIALVRLEMFKAREEIKKNNTEVTDDYLNSLFPYPE